jgi:hypothetical protein
VPPEPLPPEPVVPPEPVEPESWPPQAPARRVRAPIKERNRWDVIECRLVQGSKRIRTASVPVGMGLRVSDYFWRPAAVGGRT